MKTKGFLPMPVLILIIAVLGLAVLGERRLYRGKKIEEYKDKIIFQEIALEKTAEHFVRPARRAGKR